MYFFSQGLGWVAAMFLCFSMAMYCGWEFDEAMDARTAAGLTLTLGGVVCLVIWRRAGYRADGHKFFWFYLKDVATMYLIVGPLLAAHGETRPRSPVTLDNVPALTVPRVA